MKQFADALKTTGRFIFFRASEQELKSLGRYHLAVGLILVWLAGVGRHWDNSKADLLQISGVGSIVYVFVLAGILWVSIRPFQPYNWRYFRVLTAICFTAPPAFIYAVPVEYWYDAGFARKMNLWALAFVAIWRVALFIFFVVRSAKLHPWWAMIGTLAPVCAAVCILGTLRIAASVMDAMAGTRAAYTDPVLEATKFITNVALVSFFPLLGIYAWLVYVARNNQSNV